MTNNNVNNNNNGGEVNMDLMERIKKDNTLIKEIVSEEAYRNFLVVKNTLGEDLALTVLKKNHSEVFTKKVEIVPPEAEPKVETENSSSKAISEVIEGIKKIENKILPPKGGYAIDNRGLGLAYVAYKDNGNSEVGHESNKAHIYQMVEGKARTLLLEQAGFRSGNAKYVSPIKRTKMKFKVDFKGKAKEELLEVAHTSNALISIVQERIHGCDLTDEENLRVIFEDIDYLHRTSIELVIDACKKGYNVTQGFEFLKGYVRLYSMMSVLSNMEDVLQKAVDYRMNRISAEDFSYALFHDEVGVVEDIENAKIITKKISNNKDMIMVPDKMYVLQREIVKVFEPYCNTVIKTLFSPENGLDVYDSEVLSMAVQEPEVNDIVEISKDFFSVSSRNYIEKVKELNENSSDYDMKYDILTRQYHKELEYNKNFIYSLLDGKEMEDKANIVKAAAMCDKKHRDGEIIKKIDETKISSMPLNVTPELEIARNLIKEKNLGHVVNAGLRIKGMGCKELQEGDKLVFDHGVISKIIRNGVEEKNKKGIVAQLMSNKNDFFDSDEDTVALGQAQEVDHRLFTGTLEYYKDEEGKHWAKKTMELEDITMPKPNKDELLIKVRRTYDVDSIEKGKRGYYFNQLEDGFQIVRDYLSDNPEYTIQLVPEYVEDREYTKVRVYNAIVAVDRSGEEKLLGSYTCESKHCQKLYGGAYGHVTCVKYFAVKRLNAGDDEKERPREVLYFVLQKEGGNTYDSEHSTETTDSKEQNSILEAIKNITIQTLGETNSEDKVADKTEEATESKATDSKAENNNSGNKKTSALFSSLDNIVIKTLGDEEAENAAEVEEKTEEPKDTEKKSKGSLSDLFNNLDNVTVKTLGDEEDETTVSTETVTENETIKEAPKKEDDNKDKGAMNLFANLDSVAVKTLGDEEAETNETEDVVETESVEVEAVESKESNEVTEESLLAMTNNLMDCFNK